MVEASTDHTMAEAHPQPQQDDNEDHNFPESAPEPREELTKKEASQMVTELLTFPYNNTIEVELERETEILKGELQLDGDDGNEAAKKDHVGKEAQEDEERKTDPSSTKGATTDENSSNHQTLLQKLLPDPPLLTVPKIPKLVERTNTDTSGPLAQIAAIPSFDSESEPDRAHSFETHTYKKPTYCDICDGLLVGIIRQGMQCKQCGRNVHHGEGKGEHDDCKAEALLQACRPGECKHTNNENNMSAREELKEQNKRQSSAFPDWPQIQDMFRNHPNLWEDFAEQTEKDFMKNISQAIIEQGADNERTRKIKRARELIIKPTLHKLDSVESVGLPLLFPLVWLLYYQIFALLVVGVLTATVFGGLLLLWTEGGATREGILLYTSTVGVSIQVGMFVMALLLRWLSLYFKRKELIVDNFLQQAFTVQAEEDFGVSIQEMANILRRWSDRFVVTNVVMLVVAVMMWYKAEETFTKAVVDGVDQTLPQQFAQKDVCIVNHS